MQISSILHPDDIVLDVGSGAKRDVLAHLVAAMAAHRPALDADRLLDDLVRREDESSTAIADGIAIPHSRTEGKNDDEVVAAFGLSTTGVDFDSLDGQPTRFLMVLVSPASRPELHVAWLAHVARLLGDEPTRRRLLEATTAADVLDVLGQRERALERGAASAEPSP